MSQTHDFVKFEMELEEALNRNEFRLYYQPKVNLYTGNIEGMEALIRWEHPVRRIIPPIEFITSLEETGQIIPIGEWVIRSACKQNVEWLKAGLPPMVMSVNLSVRQLYQPDLVNVIQQVLNETGLDPQYLELEITESMMIDQYKVLDTIKQLKQLGVLISLDDFGTGYSALHYIQEFPIDKIKIDQAFIRDCTGNRNNGAIIKMIITMAHHLDMQVVAEGIETTEELIFLQENACNVGQGYIFSRPLPPEELVQQFERVEGIVRQKGISEEFHNYKLMQEALKSTRKELRDIMRQQQGMTFKVIKKDGKLIHSLCDGKLMYRMGFTSEMVIGKELKDFLPRDIAEKKIEYYLRAWEGEENVIYEEEVNGVHYLACLSPIWNGYKVEGVIGSCVDITGQKLIGEKLSKRNLQYQLIKDYIRDLIVIIDKSGMVIFASTSHENIIGIPYEEYEGRLILELVHADDIHVMRSQFSNMVASKEPCQVEFRHKHADGNWILIEAIITPVYDDNGELEYFIAVGRDITERRKSEDVSIQMLMNQVRVNDY